MLLMFAATPLLELVEKLLTTCERFMHSAQRHATVQEIIDTNVFVVG